MFKLNFKIIPIVAWVHIGLMQKVYLFCKRNDHLHTFHTSTKNCVNWLRASCWFLCLEKSAITFGEGCISLRRDYRVLVPRWAISHIAKTLGSTSSRHRHDTFASDRCLIDIDPRIFAIWVVSQSRFVDMLKLWVRIMVDFLSGGFPFLHGGRGYGSSNGINLFLMEYSSLIARNANSMRPSDAYMRQ